MCIVESCFAWMKNEDLVRVKLSKQAADVLKTMIASSIKYYSQLDAVDYDDYKLEPNEVFRINQFRGFAISVDELKNPLNAETVDITSFDMNDVKAFVFPYKEKKQDETLKYAFQAPRKETKTLRAGIKLFLDKDTYVIDMRNIITITGDVDYIVSDGIAYFQNEYRAKQIFSLIDYYREATEEDVKKFTSIQELEFNDVTAFIAMSADRIMRRRIAVLLDKEFFTNQTADEIQTKARQVIADISFVENGKIVFPNNKKECKEMLKLFCEDLYQGIFSGTTYETNSKKKRN